MPVPAGTALPASHRPFACLLRRVVQLVHHVVDVGHVAQELVERLYVMLHFNFRRLFVPLGGAGNGDGDFRAGV
jgi:hypothetical protein